MLKTFLLLILNSIFVYQGQYIPMNIYLSSFILLLRIFEMLKENIEYFVKLNIYVYLRVIPKSL